MFGAARRKSHFARRGRGERRGREPRPLLIEYERSVFGDDASRGRFCGLIDGYPNCNYSVVCAGRPHIYISVLDRIDNSSLAVRPVGDDSLAIIPQIRTAESSLMRIAAFLASAFWEGKISDCVPRR